jgi:hypothetical protein
MPVECQTQCKMTRPLMMNGMYNPIRRNRKIGVTQGGRVKNGQAREKWSHHFTQDVWTRLSEDDMRWKVIRENPSRLYYHPCDEAEYHQVLSRLPEELTRNVKAIILRRIPEADEKLGVEAQKRYQCIIMNSFPKDRTMLWTRKPGQATLHHYNPWCSHWGQNEQSWYLKWTDQELKRYYLHHLFLHEIGHFNQPIYGSAKQHEMFAENFALEWARKLGEC